VRPALPRRAGRRTNLALLGLLLVAFATGVLAYGIGTPAAATVVVTVHGAAGLGLLLLVPWKAVIVRRSWPHAASTRTLATGLGVLVAITVLTGVLHAMGVAPLSMLLVHVAIAICVVPLLLVHAWGRRQRPRRTDLSRRTLLKTGALAAGAASLWTVGEGTLR
jgi:heme A synthase